MEAGTKKVRIEERDKAKKVEAKAKRVRIEERNKARKVNTMTQAKKMDDSKRPSTNDIDSERYEEGEEYNGICESMELLQSLRKLMECDF